MRVFRQRWRFLTGAVFTTALVCLCYLVLAPSRFGGSVTYVRTTGHSMVPHLHEGDLAIARSSPSYHVGEIVAYRSDLLHRIVMHRIVGRDGDKFVFKGDNNSYTDPEHFGPDHIVGRLWVRVPRGGELLGWADDPRHVMLVGGLLVVVSAGAATRRRARRARPA